MYFVRGEWWGRKFWSRQHTMKKEDHEPQIFATARRGTYGLFGPGRDYEIQDVKKTISRLKFFKLIVEKYFINHNRKPIKTKTIKKKLNSF